MYSGTLKRILLTYKIITDVPACAKVGTLRQQIVPGAPEKQRTGTKTNRNVPACAKVGTLRQQIVPGAPEELRTGTKTREIVPGAPDYICSIKLAAAILLLQGKNKPQSTSCPVGYRDFAAVELDSVLYN